MRTNKYLYMDVCKDLVISPSFLLRLVDKNQSAVLLLSSLYLNLMNTKLNPGGWFIFDGIVSPVGMDASAAVYLHRSHDIKKCQIMINYTDLVIIIHIVSS